MAKIALYHTARWRKLRKRVLVRDGNTCTYSRLFGGECSGALDVHHIVPVSDGGPEIPEMQGCVTLCDSHHPTLEKLRRVLLTVPDSERKWKSCPHHHTSARSRIECEL